MTTTMIQHRKAARMVAAFAAAGASLLLAGPSASAAVSGLGVTPGVVPFSLAGTDYGTTCSIELAANTTADNEIVMFDIHKWDDTASPPAFVHYAVPQSDPDLAPGPVTAMWEPKEAGKYTINLAGTAETETVDVADAIEIAGLVCVVLPDFP